MEVLLRYRGRQVSNEDVAFIGQLMAEHPEATRHALSRKLCEAWNWRQANGALRDMVCRGLMLELHRAGHIQLPAIRQRCYNPLGRRRSERTKPQPVLVDRSPLCCSLRMVQPLEFHQVRRSGDERLFNGLIEHHHYLGYTQPVGEHLKYLVWAEGRPIAALSWSSAPRHLGCRDRFIGWSPEARRQNIRFIAYNSRYLIVPWVEVKHLASHVLGRMAKILPRDWEQLYGHPIYFLETFIDPERSRGTCNVLSSVMC